MKRHFIALATLCLATLAGCASSEPTTRQAPAEAANPTAELSRANRGARLKGKIAEKLTAGSYTYIALAPDQGAQRWAVVLGKDVPAEGQEIELIAMGTRKDFYSSRLARRFDEVVFAMMP